MASLLGLPDEYSAGIFESTRALWASLFDVRVAAGAAIPAPKLSLDRLANAADIHAQYWRQQLALWGAMAGGTQAQGPSTIPGDRRFASKAWEQSPLHDWLKRSYLLNARLVADLVELAEVDERTKHRLRFYSRQATDAASPANFLPTNPDAIRAAFESQGRTLVAGMQNLLDDLSRGKVSITDETAFDVGRNVAVSEGAVVFENELFQLIQYKASTDRVASRPLLVVPPCINKFYILDLQPQNSFVRFAVDSGYTVFVVSWRNASEPLAGTTWDDYLGEGALRAIDVALAISGADKVNTVGWCVGGTILACALAVARARGERKVASVTLLTTMLDFAEPGDLGVFIDEPGVRARELAIGARGIYPGRELAFVFQTLRPNDLIWPYVVDNYLKGKSPEAFDLLYWNADSTNLPGPMYCWYLRNMYLENNLRHPQRLQMCGVKVDLGRIDMPSYVLAAQEDHIVPWGSAYRTVRLLGGQSQFVLGASGHIAGVINPASKNRRSYWIGGEQGDDPKAWLATAREVPGSWWTHWLAWLKRHAPKTRPAPRVPGNSAFPAIEPAPGRYVKERVA